MNKYNKVFVTFLLIAATSCGDSSKSKAVVINGVTSYTIPGMKAVDVYGNFTSKGFIKKETISPELSTWTCTMFSGIQDYTVITTGSSNDRIVSVDGSVIATTELSGEAKEFIGYLASLPYKGSYPSTAKLWALRHYEKGGDTVISGVSFHLTSSNKLTRTLKMFVDK